MDEEALNNKIQEMITSITNIPKSQQTIKETKDKTNRLLEDLNVCIKYLMFDLEATKREKDNLRGILDRLQEDDDSNTMEEGF